jgi:hypothetical protein
LVNPGWIGHLGLPENFDVRAMRVVAEVCSVDGFVDLVLCAPEVDEQAISGLKFNQALPEQLAVETLANRLADLPTAQIVLGERTWFVK